jgi:hypothetical protein
MQDTQGAQGLHMQTLGLISSMACRGQISIKDKTSTFARLIYGLLKQAFGMGGVYSHFAELVLKGWQIQVKTTVIG